MDGERTLFDKYEEHIHRINEEIDKGLESGIDLIEEIGNHALLGRGKRLRPLLFIRCSELFGGPGEGAYRFSTVFEYIHTASLLHDDVLDNAEVRRKEPSVNLVWGNKAAVLEGDFLFSRAVEIAMDTDNIAFLRNLSRAAKRMTEGQIMEMVHTNNLDMGKDEYMKIIEAKTAALIGAACSCAGILSGADSRAVNALEGFGRNLGIAFQLMDDVLDYSSSEEIFGKPVGKDLKEGKVTLPLMYALPEIEGADRKRIEAFFGKGQSGEEDCKGLIDIVRSIGSIDRVRGEAGAYSDRAADFLDVFPYSPAKSDLLEVNRFIVEREY